MNQQLEDQIRQIEHHLSEAKRNLKTENFNPNDAFWHVDLASDHLRTLKQLLETETPHPPK